MTVLANRYELGAVLGRGGMATVYRALDRRLRRPVAVKVLHPHIAGDAVFVERFRREARAAASIAHPNVVTVYDSGSHDGQHYLVMELVEGPTLAERLREGPPPSMEQAIGVMTEAGLGLAAAHRRGLVHRDVKPGNILLAPDGAVKVADFGIARAADASDLTQTGTLLGTAAYLSPEQAAGGRVDARSDVYSAACVLYELVTGRRPFTGESAVAVARQHLEEPLPDPAGFGVPPALAALLRRGLAKDPGDRPADADELVAELRALPAAPTVPRPSRRAATVLGTTMVLLGAAVGLLVLGDEPDDGAVTPTTAPTADPISTTTATAQAPTTSPPAPTPGAAAGAVFDQLDEAVRSGEVRRGDVSAIADKVSDVLKELREGKPGEARDKLEDAYEEVENLVEDGKLPESWASAIRAALDALAAALPRE